MLPIFFIITDEILQRQTLKNSAAAVAEVYLF